MASELCMNCFNVKGKYEICPCCGYAEGTPPKQPHHLTPGTVIGNHFIVGTAIGSGGFGVIYKCFDMTLGVIVAVKEFYPAGLVNRSPGERQVGLLSGDRQKQYRTQLNRFLMEAQSIAQFGKATDIVNVYDFFEENGTAYIIMEFIDGVLLEDYLKRQGAMHPKVAMSITMLIIEAVKKIHSKGIIHRDISPDNIFITDENSIKIFDFGAAILNNSKEGMEGEEIIKMGYSAPEQYRKKSNQGFFTDVYSTGAIMYHMLTGNKPMESTEREHKDDLKSPMELGVKINSNIDRAVMEAMAVKPELRFQGIQQFEDALRNKRAAEYPKVKLRKKRHKRNWIIGSAVTMVMAVGVGIGLYSTILKPESEIFDTSITQETTISVWVENEDQKKVVEELTEEGFKKGGLSESMQQNPEKWQKFWSENEKVTVEVSVHEDIQNDLEKATEDEIPNMYITDHVSDVQKSDLISLEGIYNDINVSDYAYMSEYTNHFPTYKEMPTGLDTLLVYVCNISYDKDMGLESKSAVFDSETEESEAAKETDKKESVTEDEIVTVELQQLISEDADEYEIKSEETVRLSNELASFEQSAVAYAISLDDKKEWDTYFRLDEDFVPNTSTLEKIQGFNAVAKSSAYMVSSYVEGEKEDTEIYGNNIVAGAAYRHTMEEALEKKDESNITNRLEGYDTYVVTSDDKMLVKYSERYGVTMASDSQQKIACKRLIYVMLQAPGQDKKNSYDGETVFPIRIAQLREFEKIKRNMQDFPELFAEEKPCVIIGNLTGNMHEFTKGLDKSATERKKLQAYCSEYVNQYKDEEK